MFNYLKLLVCLIFVSSGCQSLRTNPEAESADVKGVKPQEITVEQCLNAVPQSTTLKEVITLARSRKILMNALSPESCQLVVKNLELQKGSIGKFYGKFESLELKFYEARDAAMKAEHYPRGAPGLPENYLKIANAKDASDGSPCGLQISMNSPGEAKSGWGETRSFLGYPSFKFFVPSRNSTFPVIGDPTMVSDLSTDSFDGGPLADKILTKNAQSVDGFKYFIKFNGARKITSFGLVSEAAQIWECKLY